jgi:hypothetical protein
MVTYLDEYWLTLTDIHNLLNSVLGQGGTGYLGAKTSNATRVFFDSAPFKLSSF